MPPGGVTHVGSCSRNNVFLDALTGLLNGVASVFAEIVLVLGVMNPPAIIPKDNTRMPTLKEIRLSPLNRCPLTLIRSPCHNAPAFGRLPILPSLSLGNTRLENARRSVRKPVLRCQY